MKKTLVIAMTTALFLAGAATAQIDPDPDGMSVYFDTEGLDFCVETGGEYAEVMTYFLLTNPSADYIGGWEAHVERAIHAYMSGTWYAPMGNIANCYDDDYIVGFDFVPMDDSTVLLMWCNTIFIGEPLDHAEYTVRGVHGSQSFPGGTPGYLAGWGEFVPCNLIHASPGDPVAWINHPDACDIVADERMAWGDVKSLY